MDVFVSGITFKKRVSYTVIKRVSKKIVNMCNNNGVAFIRNGNML